MVVVPEPVLPRPFVLELAELAPEVVESTIGATAAESVIVVVVAGSTVVGVVRLVVSPAAASLSVPLLQAVSTPAIIKTANNFFMIFFELKPIARTKFICSSCLFLRCGWCLFR